jgi:uncharacterized protein YbjT (DUF2867 family)
MRLSAGPLRAAAPAPPRARAARRRAPRLSPRANLSFINAPVEALVAGGAVVLGGAGVMLKAALDALRGGGGGGAPEAAPAPAPPPPPPPRGDAVLVFGASGRVGRLVVGELLAAGRTVVAAARDAGATAERLAAAGAPAGAAPGGGALLVDGGVDITNAETLTDALFEGVTQVVLATGGVFGRLPDGGFGALEGMTSERVDAGGAANVAAAAAARLPRPAMRTKEVLSLRSAEDLEAAGWRRLDDVIMGGASSSALAPAPAGGAAAWRGELVFAGGGFCGARTGNLQLDLSAYDGIRLRARCPAADAVRTFKLNIKTSDFSAPEDTYQASFDVLPNGDPTTVLLRWDEFVPVRKARVLEGGPLLDPRRISSFGLIYSRFAYNGAPNLNCAPGPFELLLEGVEAFAAPRPQCVLVSSAGVERNARVGDDAAARAAEIPIVQLNPGGVLNWKYEGEAAVRASGLAYCVVRPTGMSDDAGTAGPALLEAAQGDRLTGKVARAEVAATVAAALASPAAAGKTFELRRSEAADAQGIAPSAADTRRMFLALVSDARRPAYGIPPMPQPAPPPPPPDAARTAEILADERVRAAQARVDAGVAGGRARGAGEGGAAAAAAAEPEKEPAAAAR